MIKKLPYFFLGLFIFWENANAQTITDSSGRRLQPSDTINRKIDSVIQTHSPKIAARRSAILPGWGQAYNKKYWKIPIVYGALGVSTGFFFYNLKNYRDTRFAYQAKYKASLPAGQRDSTDYPKIKPKLEPLDQETLRYYRNEFRRDVDYSVLVFILLWGLNVIDATVDAHLKTFDVSPDLSFKIKAGYSEIGETHGLSLVLFRK